MYCALTRQKQRELSFSPTLQRSFNLIGNTFFSLTKVKVKLDIKVNMYLKFNMHLK